MLRSIEINIIVYNPFDKSAINAGTRGRGIIKSTDGGESWKATELVRDNISAIAIDSVYPNIIYASDEWRIFKSEDAGESWFEINNGFERYDISRFLLLPLIPQTIEFFTGTAGSGVFRYDNSLPLTKRKDTEAAAFGPHNEK